MLNTKLNKSVGEMAMTSARRVVTLAIQAIRAAIPTRIESVNKQDIPVTNQASKRQSGAIYFK